MRKITIVPTWRDQDTPGEILAAFHADEEFLVINSVVPVTRTQLKEEGRERVTIRFDERRQKIVVEV